MTLKHEIMALIAKVSIFLVVYGGIHVSMTSLLEVISYVNMYHVPTSSEVLLGVLALVVAIGSAILFHFLTKLGVNGWRLLVTITPILPAIGGILTRYNFFGGVLIAAFVPALMYLVHPAKIDKWTRAILGIDEGGRVAAVLGAGAAMVLLLEDNMAFTSCQITFMALIFLLIFAGCYIGIMSVVNTNKASEQHNSIDAIAIGELPRIAGIAAYVNLIAWGSFPLIALLVLNEFALLTSYGSSLDPVSAGWLTLISLTVGVAVAAILMIVARGKAILHDLVFALLCVFGTCLGIALLGVGLDGNAILVLRMVVLVTMPSLLVAMLGLPVPDVKGIAFHFWKVFLAIGSIVLLIAGVALKISNGEYIYVAIYLIMTGFAAASTITSRFAVKNHEVTNQ